MKYIQKNPKDHVDVIIQLANGISIHIHTHEDDPNRFNYLVVDSTGGKTDGSTDIEEFINFKDYGVEEIN